MSRVSDMITRHGQAQGDRIRRSGERWGGVVASAGQILPAIRQGREADAAAAQQADDRALQRRATEASVLNSEDAIADRAAGRASAQSAQLDEQKSRRVAGWLAEVATAQDPEIARAAYEVGRTELVKEGILPDHEAPKFFPGLGWVRSRFAIMGIPNDRIEAFMPTPKDPKTREIRTRNADGSESVRIVEDTPGFTATSAPEQPKAPAGSPQWLNGGRDYRVPQPGDRPYQPPSQAQPSQPQQDWVLRNGAVTPIARGTAQPGDQPYDPVSARQQNGAVDPQTEAIDTANEVVRIATALRDSPGFSGAFGVVSSRLPTYRQGTADAEVLLNSLRSLLTLENTGKLKGVLSNADMELLRQASSTLDARMGEPAAKAELDRLIQVMSKVGGVTGSGPSMPPGATLPPARGTGPGPSPRRIGRFEVLD